MHLPNFLDLTVLLLGALNFWGNAPLRLNPQTMEPLRKSDQVKT